jgi:type II secretory pathway component GspD/PulD (secretin)
MREIRDHTQYKMPGLGSVPGLGRLFRSERDVKKTVELVILLRPVVVEDGDWAKMLEEQAARQSEIEKRGAKQ